MTSTTQSSTKCPKCGAEVMTNEFGVVDYKCDSWANTPKNTFEQSEKCTLRASLLRAAEALRPFAGVANQINGSVKDNSELFYHHSFGYSSVYVNMGDVRRASSVLKEISKDL